MKLSNLICIVVIILTACATPAKERPADFGLHYEWDTGPLPPEYHYHLTIDVQVDGNGTFAYYSGYGEQGTEPDYEQSFVFGVAELDALYKEAVKDDLLRKSWQSGELLIGGSSAFVQIVADGKRFRSPSSAEMKTADRQALENFATVLYGFIPVEIWQEMERLQAAREE